MKTDWKKYLWRHGLFTYARDSLVFFVNLYVWDQVQDLKVIALFNIIYLASHTAMFYIGLPFIKKPGGMQRFMKGGIIGLALTLLLIMVLRERVVDHIYTLGVLVGLPNGAYWLVNHIQSFDLSDNSNRTKFFSLRKAVQGGSHLATPAVGWLVFSALGDSDVGYGVIFGCAMLAMIVAWSLTEVYQDEEADMDFVGSLKELFRTKYFKIKQLNGFLYGLSLRSALSTVLLPFLIFQVVERESKLTMIQTAVEILAIVAAYVFANHRKNTSYINRLLILNGLFAGIGLLGLFLHFSLASYMIFIVTYVLALSTANIANGTLSNNYATTIKDYKKHRMEYMVVREAPAILGFISGYVFVYFFSDLSISSVRPLLLVMMVATAGNVGISMFIWRHVQRTGS